jgi:hypothetical protein
MTQNLKLVPVEATEEMCRAGCKAVHANKPEIDNAYRLGDKIIIARTKMLRRWEAMLAAAPAPDIDDLCRAMWPEHWLPGDENGFKYDTPEAQMYRDSDRARMTAFLAKIGGKP